MVTLIGDEQQIGCTTSVFDSTTSKGSLIDPPQAILRYELKQFRSQQDGYSLMKFSGCRSHNQFSIQKLMALVFRRIQVVFVGKLYYRLGDATFASFG